MIRRHAPFRPPLAAYLEGEVTPSERVAIEAHVRDSGSARRHLEQLDELRRTLARAPDGVAESEPAAAAELWRMVDAAAVPRAPRGSRRVWRTICMSAAGAALAVIVFARTVWAPSGPPSANDHAQGEFGIKSATTEPEDRWVRIEALRVAEDGVARPLAEGGAVHAQDRLVFRYASGGPAPFGFLMVFAIDAAQRVRWYYPAYETAGTDPSSIEIRGDRRAASLPDAIEHLLPAGPLVFYGLFTHVPLHVLDVERQIEATLARQGWNPALPPRLPIDGSGQHRVAATVVR